MIIVNVNIFLQVQTTVLLSKAVGRLTNTNETSISKIPQDIDVNITLWIFSEPYKGYIVILVGKR